MPSGLGFFYHFCYTYENRSRTNIPYIMQENIKNTKERSAICCPSFDPEPWDRKAFVWEDKPFVRGTIRSFFHIPMNFGSVISELMKKIEASGAQTDEPLVLSYDSSSWKSELLISVKREVPGLDMVVISGTFMTKVFEGPYKNMGEWIREMKEHVEGQGKEVKKLYAFYTACPKCARKYGKNYVVLFAQID